MRVTTSFIRLTVIVAVSFGHIVLHAQTNVWTGTWSLGAPTAGQDIDIQADIGWSDLNGVTSFGNWTHTSGTMTWQGTSGLAMNDVVLNGGSWTHSANSTTALGKQHEIRLAATAFTLNSGATIDASEKGYAKGQGPGSPGTLTRGGASYGGEGGWSDNGDGSIAGTYGLFSSPNELGSGGGIWGGGNGRAGGGAVHLDIAGAATLDGTIAANGGNGSATAYTSGGSGGSIYVEADTLAGTGLIQADGGDQNHSSGTGGGGRIALVLTGSDVVPALNVHALGSSDGSYNRTSAAGTIYVQTQTQGAGNGTLVIDNNDISTPRSTAIPDGAVWSPTAIETRNGGILGVDAGRTLNLKNAVTSDSDLNNDGIRVRQGTLNLVDGNIDIADFSLFIDDTYVLTGDVTVKAGGALTHSGNINSTENYTMDLTLNGNLTVESGGAVSADGKGYSVVNQGPGAPTGSLRAGGSHGGMAGDSAVGTGDVGPTYGSVLNPSVLGSSGGAAGAYSTPAGGVAKLNVLGNVVLDGAISANAGIMTRSYQSGGSGGSVLFTAPSITGNGIISANGGNSSNGSGAGGGGRVAVYLTASNSLDGVTLQAYGGPGSGIIAGASGTVYRQAVTDAAGGGDIIIGNGTTATQANTHLPPMYTTIPWTDDLSAAHLFLEDNSRLLLTSDMEFEALDMTSGALLDLAGYSLSVRALSINGTPYTWGTYLESDLGATVIGLGEVLVIPEPATAVLLLAGGCVMMRRRRISTERFDNDR